MSRPCVVCLKMICYIALVWYLWTCFGPQLQHPLVIEEAAVELVCRNVHSLNQSPVDSRSKAAPVSKSAPLQTLSDADHAAGQSQSDNPAHGAEPESAAEEQTGEQKRGLVASAVVWMFSSIKSIVWWGFLLYFWWLWLAWKVATIGFWGMVRYWRVSLYIANCILAFLLSVDLNHPRHLSTIYNKAFQNVFEQAFTINYQHHKTDRPEGLPKLTSEAYIETVDLIFARFCKHAVWFAAMNLLPFLMDKYSFGIFYSAPFYVAFCFTISNFIGGSIWERGHAVISRFEAQNSAYRRPGGLSVGVIFLGVAVIYIYLIPIFLDAAWFISKLILY